MNSQNKTYRVIQSQQQRISVGALHSGRADHTGQYFTLVLFGVFVILLLMALWMGTVAFRTINTMQSTTDDARLALNSLQNRVRAFDEAGSFGTGEGPEGKSIVFTYRLEAGDYETRLYLYQGALVQELAFSTDPYVPMTATKIVETSTFSFQYEDGLLTVTTDQGSAKVALRSEIDSKDAKEAASSATASLNAASTSTTNANSDAEGGVQ